MSKKNDLKELKNEIKEFSDKKEKETKDIVDNMVYRQTLVKNLRNLLVFDIIIMVIAIIVLSIIMHKNILAYDSNHFNYLYDVFLILLVNLGIGFIITGSNKKIDDLYKKKSKRIGLKIILLSILLVILEFFK